MATRIPETGRRGKSGMLTPSLTSFSESFLAETTAIVKAIDNHEVERLATGLAAIRDRGGRLFVLGVGGSAAYAGHAVSDFRKITELEAYAPTDNVAELTARINDDGWDTSFVNWLRGSRLVADDGLLILSVGGGSRERMVSVNLVKAIEYAQEVGAHVFGIVGRDGGFTREVAEAAVVIPPLFPERITAHTEGLCAVIWHLLVFHPALKLKATKWESLSPR
jgi:D-sedoheptulose 7-phosphate isomerase